MFKPGDVVLSSKRGVEMAVERVLGPGLYRCAWSVDENTEQGWISFNMNDEFEHEELTLVERADERSGGWRHRDIC